MVAKGELFDFQPVVERQTFKPEVEEQNFRPELDINVNWREGR